MKDKNTLIIIYENAKGITEKVRELNISHDDKKRVANALHITLRNKEILCKAYLQEKIPSYQQICEKIYDELKDKNTLDIIFL